MGSCCPNLFSKKFKPYYRKPEISSSFQIFTNENDDSFYIPTKYLSIKSDLLKILNLDSSLWQNHKQFIYESKEYLYEKLNTLDNFLFQEDNFESNSQQKSDFFGVKNSIDSPKMIQMSSLSQHEGVNENELSRKRTNTLNSNIDYMEKFRVKKFIIEISKLSFLGDNNPENMSLTKPWIEINFFDTLGKKIDINGEILRFSTKEHKNGYNPVWNEVFELDLQKLESFSLNKAQFSITINYKNEKKGKEITLGEEKYMFYFNELLNQMILEKAINIKNKNDLTGGYIAIFFFRCQLIHDYFKFLVSWKNEIEVKLEIINRLIQKMAFDEKGQKLKGIAINNYKQENNIFNETWKSEEHRKNTKNFSLMSGDNSEINMSSIYDNHYYLK